MNKDLQLSEVVQWPGVVEMCRQLKVSIQYGYHLIWSGRIAAQKIGGQWRIPPAAIEARLKRKATK